MMVTKMVANFQIINGKNKMSKASIEARIASAQSRMVLLKHKFTIRTEKYFELCRHGLHPVDAAIQSKLKKVVNEMEHEKKVLAKMENLYYNTCVFIH